MAIVTASLGISVGCYLFGTLYAPRANDFREELKVPLRDEEVRAQHTSSFGNVSSNLGNAGNAGLLRNPMQGFERLRLVCRWPRKTAVAWEALMTAELRSRFNVYNHVM